ncbi:ABC transporter permease [Nocardioides mesophilus]|uniref:ABC transporter permease n=1 Tax=Nocardioides mesophilus TaxID=433659 RepID=A0A7G9R6I8_9ACTN|nr:ABC transporter permease [Nocardioides mesophilus]QNN51213.1 ABC transporter permease [Nocardioides mesophilus]
MLQSVLDWLADPATWQGENGIPNRLLEHGLLTVTATLAAAALGLPLAVWLGHKGRGGTLAINISNVGRAVPTFAVLLLLALGPVGTEYFGAYGRAGLSTLVALVLFALPPIITNTYVGMQGVDRDTVEAARGMGMTSTQLLRSVEVPLALPLILTGLRLAIVQVWATATIAALVAGPGLGRIVTLGFVRQDTGQVVGGALVIAVIALLLEVGMVALQRVLDPVARARRTTAAAAALGSVGSRP